MGFHQFRFIPKPIFIILALLVFGGMTGPCGKGAPPDEGVSLDESAGEGFVAPQDEETTAEQEGETPAGPECGNGTLEQDEECDDGNLADGDGCDAGCDLEPIPVGCGNGAVEEGEECDDGNDSNNDGCKNNCKKNTCGDKVVNEGVEECDELINCHQCKSCYGFVFVSNREDGYSNLYYSCTAEDYQPKRLTNSNFNPDNSLLKLIGYRHPTISSDGTMVAFERHLFSDHKLIYGDLRVAIRNPATDKEFPTTFKEVTPAGWSGNYAPQFPQFDTQSSDYLTFVVQDMINPGALEQPTGFLKKQLSTASNPLTIYKTYEGGITLGNFQFVPTTTDPDKKWIMSLKDNGNYFDGSSEDNTFNLYYFNYKMAPPQIKPVYVQKDADFSQLAISPDGNQIVFVKGAGKLYSQLLLCDYHSNTESQTFGCNNVTELMGVGNDQNPCWTHDGKNLIFSGAVFIHDWDLTDGAWDLYMMPKEGRAGVHPYDLRLSASEHEKNEIQPACVPVAHVPPLPKLPVAQPTLPVMQQFNGI